MSEVYTTVDNLKTIFFFKHLIEKIRIYASRFSVLGQSDLWTLCHSGL